MKYLWLKRESLNFESLKNIHGVFIVFKYTHNVIFFSLFFLGLKKCSIQFNASRGNYLYSAVEKFMVLCEILQANKSIRIAQLTLELSLIFSGSKIIRQTVILFHTLQLTITLPVYFHFSNNASIESSSSYFFSKVNSFEVWRYNFCYSVCRSNDYRG